MARQDHMDLRAHVAQEVRVDHEALADHMVHVAPAAVLTVLTAPVAPAVGRSIIPLLPSILPPRQTAQMGNVNRQ